MELGEKLKTARLEAGLSQKALCGDTITRNMLSQIESGKARPSMDTLRVLATRLGKPVSWFLEEAPATESMDLYAAGEYEKALESLENSPGSAQTALLRKLTLLQLGQAALSKGHLPHARELFHKAMAIATVPVPGLDRELSVLLALAGEDIPVSVDDRPLQLEAGRCLSAGDYARAKALLSACGNPDPILLGRCAMGEGDYGAARGYLEPLAESDPRAIPLLEICCRELGDYKGAYEYALRQRN